MLCDSLDCFINQKPHSDQTRYEFYQHFDGFTMKLMKNSKELNEILNRTEIHKKRGKFDDN